MELDRVPLWRGDHVAIKQLQDDFARYLYLPRLQSSSVLLGAIRDGLALLLWPQDSFAYADSFDQAASRYRGLRSGQHIPISESNLSGLIVRSDVARKQLEAEAAAAAEASRQGGGAATAVTNAPSAAGESASAGQSSTSTPSSAPTRFHGSVVLILLA